MCSARRRICPPTSTKSSRCRGDPIACGSSSASGTTHAPRGSRRTGSRWCRTAASWSNTGGSPQVWRSAPREVVGDGVGRVKREIAGRRGKPVTTIAGVPLGDDALRELAAELKRRCGSGGTAKDGVIEIQGDHRDAVIAVLEAKGYTVKRAGG